MADTTSVGKEEEKSAGKSLAQHSYQFEWKKITAAEKSVRSTCRRFALQNTKEKRIFIYCAWNVRCCVPWSQLFQMVAAKFLGEIICGERWIIVLKVFYRFSLLLLSGYQFLRFFCYLHILFAAASASGHDCNGAFDQRIGCSGARFASTRQPWL